MSDTRRAKCHTGPRNSDGTWVAGVERGPYAPFPFPVGYTQGELTIVEWRRSASGYNPYVECSCGNRQMVHRSNFVSGKSTRCNFCAKKASGATAKKYRGYAAIVPDDYHRERLLNRISSCIQRCENDRNNQYKNYGARGIRVCKAWLDDRKEFLRYLTTLEGWDVAHHELDRIDNNKGYEPGNLRFCSKADNIRNRRTVKQLQKEVTDLRRALRRAEKLLRRNDGLWADYST